MLQPLGNRLTVKPIQKETTTASGIILQQDKEARTEKGEVVLIGRDVAEDIKVGDIIYFQQYAPDEFEIDGETIYIISEENVVAKES